MTSSPRRRWGVVAAGLIVVVALFAGRWAAVETAERAWAATVDGGTAYLAARNLARWVHAAVLIAAIAWGVAQFYFVYRAIGSVQLPRRLGDLEIVEAVPHWLLRVIAVAGGALYGGLLVLGTSHWWRLAALAAAPPYFGLIEPVLEHDAGYYVAAVPWSAAVQDRTLVAMLSALVVVGGLYAAIGSFRIEHRRPTASPYTRAHLGTLLAALAVVLAWGAVLDPAEVIAGLHGPLDHAAVAVRLPGATAVAWLAGGVALLTLTWAWRGRPALAPHAWTALLAAQLTVYTVAPALVRAASGRSPEPAVDDLAAARAEFQQRATGLELPPEGAIPPFQSATAALRIVPLWDAMRIKAVAHREGVFDGLHTIAAVAPNFAPGTAGPSWLVAPAPASAAGQRRGPPPEWLALHRGAGARSGPPFLARESDSGLVFAPAPVRDSVTWFGPGFREFAVATANTWPVLRHSGIPLDTWWSRTALAWALQSPELLKSQDDRQDLELLWRRDLLDRLGRLLPVAEFDDPVPLLADSTLWWVAYGYAKNRSFPLAGASAPSPAYEHPGFVGVMRAAGGDTRLYLAPGYDSLSAAWARILHPLVLPPDSVPPVLRNRLPFPVRLFRRLAARVPMEVDTELVARPSEPYMIPAPSLTPTGAAGPATAWWLAQGFERRTPPTFRGLLAGTMMPAGPLLVWWRPSEPLKRPTQVGGATVARTTPGVLRIWLAGDALISVQVQFADGGADSRAPQVAEVFVSWGGSTGTGPTPQAALRDMLTHHTEPTDTTLAGRWHQVQRLVQRADSALAAGDLAGFARLYDEIRHVLGRPRRQLAPPSSLR